MKRIIRIKEKEKKVSRASSWLILSALILYILLSCSYSSCPSCHPVNINPVHPVILSTFILYLSCQH